MFTGLIESTGRVEGLIRTSSGLKLSIQDEYIAQNVREGDSVSVDGACLTVISIDKNIVYFDVSEETFKRTILKGYRKGTIVNLELALRADKRLDGHLVMGHIDTVGRVATIDKMGDYLQLSIEFDRLYSPLVVEKGSIAINGVSLTVNKAEEQRASLMLIPSTLEKTNLKLLKTYDAVNIEFDIIGKYIIRYLSRGGTPDDRLRRLIEEVGL